MGEREVQSCIPGNNQARILACNMCKDLNITCLIGRALCCGLCHIEHVGSVELTYGHLHQRFHEYRADMKVDLSQKSSGVDLMRLCVFLSNYRGFSHFDSRTISKGFDSQFGTSKHIELVRITIVYYQWVLARQSFPCNINIV